MAGQKGAVAGEARGGIRWGVQEGVRLDAAARLFAGAEPSFSDDGRDLDRTQNRASEATGGGGEKKETRGRTLAGRPPAAASAAAGPGGQTDRPLYAFDAQRFDPNDEAVRVHEPGLI